MKCLYQRLFVGFLFFLLSSSFPREAWAVHCSQALFGHSNELEALIDRIVPESVPRLGVSELGVTRITAAEVFNFEEARARDLAPAALFPQGASEGQELLYLGDFDLRQISELDPLLSSPGVETKAVIQENFAILAISEENSSALTLLFYNRSKGEVVDRIDLDLGESIGLDSIQILKESEYLLYLNQVMSDGSSRLKGLGIGQNAEELELKPWTEEGSAPSNIVRLGSPHESPVPILWQRLGFFAPQFQSRVLYAAKGFDTSGRAYVFVENSEDPEQTVLRHEGDPHKSFSYFKLEGMLARNGVEVSPNLQYIAYQITSPRTEKGAVALYHRPTGNLDVVEGSYGVWKVSNSGDLVLQKAKGRLVYLNGEFGALDSTNIDEDPAAPMDVVFAGESGQELYFLTHQEVLRYGHENPIASFPEWTIDALAIQGDRGIVLGYRKGETRLRVFSFNLSQPGNEYEVLEIEVHKPIDLVGRGSLSAGGRYYAFGFGKFDYIVDLDELRVIRVVDRGDWTSGRIGFAQWKGRTWYRRFWQSRGEGFSIVSVPLQDIDQGVTETTIPPVELN